MNKQPKRTAKTRQAIIDAFWELYCHNEIEAITIKEIADAAGIYRSTFYEYFGSIYDVLEYIEDNLINAYNGMIASISLDSDIEDILDNVTDFYKENIEYVSFLVSPDGDKHFMEQLRSLMAPKIVEMLAADSEENSPERIECEIFFEVLFSTMMSILNYWNAHKDLITMKETFNTGMRIMRSGLWNEVQRLSGKLDTDPLDQSPNTDAN